MKHLAALFIVVLFFSTNLLAHGDKQQNAKPVAISYIVSPKDGETTTQTFKVVFGLNGMGVSPAGIEKANTGHHHLLVDGLKLPDLTKPLGSSVKHFGSGQTETVLTLTPGKHTLQLILADHNHIPHTPAIISKKITIHVE